MVGTTLRAFAHPTAPSTPGDYNRPFTIWKRPVDRVFPACSGEGISMASTVVARRCAMFFFALFIALTGARHVTEAHAAGAIAVGTCGAYGQAYDFPEEAAARAAAQKQ